jgi:uncharacterized membrane protein YcaP (DUF421 family)
VQSLWDFGEAVFGHRNAVTWWQECDRAVLLFFYGLVLVRLGGARVFGKWAALDFVVSVVIGSNLSRAMTGGAPLLGTMAATTAIMLLHWLLAYLAARSAWFSRLVEGTPFELGRGGKLQRDRLPKSLVSQNDIEEALRQSGVNRVEDTTLIILEPSGKINVLKSGK